ncbi:MAG: hypothetical protein ACT4O1_10740 [Gemmatimonadota bacterium]
MIFRAAREKKGDDRFFELKALLLVLGASLGIAGMVSQRSWLVLAGIGVLAVAMILRLFDNRRSRP